MGVRSSCFGVVVPIVICCHMNQIPLLLREHPFSTYAHRGRGGLAKSVRITKSLLVTVTSFCVRGGGEGVKKGRNFAYVLNGCSLIGRAQSTFFGAHSVADIETLVDKKHFDLNMIRL